MRHSILLFILTLLSGGTLASAQTCKANQYDMLDWIVPQRGTVNGHYNVIYPQTGTFYWVKGVKGFPWDVDTFDANYIYQSITEQDWNDASTYKIFEKALPWMPRCITIPATPAKLTAIQVSAQDTKFDLHLSCIDYTTHSLGYVINEVWGPYKQTFGNLPSTPTLTLSYRYSCDSQYSNCQDKETFAMQKGVGLVEWTHYTLQNGTYVQVGQSLHSGPATLGTITPVHPCW
jgi:hypothetical protein